MTRMPLSLAIVAVLAVAPTSAAPDLPPVARQVSIAEIDGSLKALDHDRTSGREGERQAAAFLERKLKEYGVRFTRHDMSAFLSWPVRGEVRIDGDGAPLNAVTPSFGVSTAKEGLAGTLVFIPQTREEDLSPIAEDVRGRIVVATGLISPESVLRAQRAGAIGLIHVNLVDVLHEMTATTIWGTPTTASAARLPTIPVVSVTKRDGERLRRAAAADKTVRLFAEVQTGWADIPLVVAEVPGRTLDFILVATHLDAWYAGMTDTAGTVASILEMARVLQARHGELERGVRFAWWPGHSFGRYPGSTWYVDHFWGELDEHCVTYTNLDGSGRRGSQMDKIAAGGWPGIGEFTREFARSLPGTLLPARERLFRPTRDSDSSFQGLGIPHFSVGVPGPPDGHPDVEPAPSGLIRYWHTAEDTYDKLDLRALERDTQYRVAQIYELARRPVLPLRVAPIVAAYVANLDALAKAAGTAFDLSGTRRSATALLTLAERFDAQAPPSDRNTIAARNALATRLTHRLNATLYTGAGRFDQDWAADLPHLPLLARAAELPSLAADADAAGFLRTDLLRGRNAVEATLRDATRSLEQFLAAVRPPAAPGGSGDRSTLVRPPRSNKP